MRTPGLEPGTFGFGIQRATNCATPSVDSKTYRRTEEREGVKGVLRIELRSSASKALVLAVTPYPLRARRLLGKGMPRLEQGTFSFADCCATIAPHPLRARRLLGTLKNTAMGNRTPISRVKTEYPKPLDDSGQGAETS
jgi:hypothetical protein